MVDSKGILECGKTTIRICWTDASFMAVITETVRSVKTGEFHSTESRIGTTTDRSEDFERPFTTLPGFSGDLKYFAQRG